MKKLLSAIVACSLLLSSCTPHQISLARRCVSSTVLIHLKVYIPAKGHKKERDGWGTCSGVYVAPHLILTADHCVDMNMEEKSDIKLKEIWVRDSNDNGARAYVVKMDPMRDLALLKTDLKGTPVKLARKVTVGEDVWIVGQPLGMEFVVSKGIVSKLNYATIYFPINHFVTTATILPGNSGGPAYNSKGQLIGIVTMSTSMFGAFGAAGLGIVVQIDEVRDFLKHVK